MAKVADNIDNESVIEQVGKEVLLLCSHFPCRTISSSQQK